MNAAQKKKITMIALMVAAGGLCAYQLAPALGLGGAPSKPTNKTEAKVQHKPGAPRRAPTKGAPDEAAPAGPRVAGRQAPAPAPAPAETHAPRRANGSGAAAPKPGALQPGAGTAQPAARKVHPRELAGLLEDSEFAYECEGLRNPAADLVLVARKRNEAVEPAYRPTATLDGILWSETRPMAIIGGKLYEKGQSFDGKGTILEIQPAHIVVGCGVETFGISVSGLSAPSVSSLPVEMHAESRPAPRQGAVPGPSSDGPDANKELWETKTP